MKLRTIVLSLSCLGLVACEGGEEEAPAAEAPKPAEQPAAAPAEPPKPEPMPQQACAELAAAAKANDEAKINSLLAAGGAEILAGEGVKDAVMATWSTATCGEAKIEGDKATVAIMSGPEGKDAKEAPFVKAEGAWKFDLAAYLAKYPVDMGKGKKGKKGKKAKGKKTK